MKNAIIVSRHPGAIAWLRDQFPFLADAPVIAEATSAEVEGKIVFGNLPLSLASEADSVMAIEFAGAPPRGAEYSIDDMRAAGARLRQYAVVDVTRWSHDGELAVAQCMALAAVAAARQKARR